MKCQNKSKTKESVQAQLKCKLQKIQKHHQKGLTI